MIPTDVLKQIRRIQIYTSRTVNEIFAGEYESTFKGQGMQFDEVREYAPGDDVRTIDWNVTARMNRPFIKRFVEERELTVMLMVDLSASGIFATVGRLKNELAAELCAVLAFCAIKNGDKIGLITFTDRIEKFIPPGKGTRHVLRVIRELLYHEPTQLGTDIALALDYLGRVIRKKATVFLVSDFYSPDLTRSLRTVNKRHDLIAVSIHDPAEKVLPKVAGLLTLRDAETGKMTFVDASSRRVRQHFAEQARRHEEQTLNMLQSCKVDCISLQTDRDYIPELVRFFRMREKRR